jgi:hypothetical protein
MPWSASLSPGGVRVCSWRDKSAPGVVLKLEFLPDLEIDPAESTVRFDDCDDLGATELRGSGHMTQTPGLM